MIQKAEEESRILTPYNENRLYKLHRPSTKKPVYVQEVPACRFENVAICLASNNIKDAPKLKVLAKRFAQLWELMASGGIPGIKP